ncbi:unnamed protein product [Vitrella brassicaformis CCMP3155]|uniref:Uncharacterized protein n=1 Tax=Vitrella brassicaformis (strain CCMP3155) TaxID=1169540 RepID=A0A0G4FLX4_VITBC|nr:unnamed protein product [Vitrella brassicaformis CCMP3155]|eukprot:CEM14784.1 unnamed protein product [Vitrella brassicaformis CCMP3155]
MASCRLGTAFRKTNEGAKRPPTEKGTNLRGKEEGEGRRRKKRMTVAVTSQVMEGLPVPKEKDIYEEFTKDGRVHLAGAGLIQELLKASTGGATDAQKVPTYEAVCPPDADSAMLPLQQEPLQDGERRRDQEEEPVAPPPPPRTPTPPPSAAHTGWRRQLEVLTSISSAYGYSWGKEGPVGKRKSRPPTSGGWKVLKGRREQDRDGDKRRVEEKATTYTPRAVRERIADKLRSMFPSCRFLLRELLITPAVSNASIVHQLDDALPSASPAPVDLSLATQTARDTIPPSTPPTTRPPSPPQTCRPSHAKGGGFEAPRNGGRPFMLLFPRYDVVVMNARLPRTRCCNAPVLCRFDVSEGLSIACTQPNCQIPALPIEPLPVSLRYDLWGSHMKYNDGLLPPLGTHSPPQTERRRPPSAHSSSCASDTHEDASNRMWAFQMPAKGVPTQQQGRLGVRGKQLGESAPSSPRDKPTRRGERRKSDNGQLLQVERPEIGGVVGMSIVRSSATIDAASPIEKTADIVNKEQEETVVEAPPLAAPEREKGRPATAAAAPGRDQERAESPHFDLNELPAFRHGNRTPTLPANRARHPSFAALERALATAGDEKTKPSGEGGKNGGGGANGGDRSRHSSQSSLILHSDAEGPLVPKGHGTTSTPVISPPRSRPSTPSLCEGDEMGLRERPRSAPDSVSLMRKRLHELGWMARANTTDTYHTPTIPLVHHFPPAPAPHSPPLIQNHHLHQQQQLRGDIEPPRGETSPLGRVTPSFPQPEPSQREEQPGGTTALALSLPLPVNLFTRSIPVTAAQNQSARVAGRPTPRPPRGRRTFLHSHEGAAATVLPLPKHRWGMPLVPPLAKIARPNEDLEQADEHADERRGLTARPHTSRTARKAALVRGGLGIGDRFEYQPCVGDRPQTSRVSKKFSERPFYTPEVVHGPSMEKLKKAFETALTYSRPAARRLTDG